MGELFNMFNAKVTDQSRGDDTPMRFLYILLSQRDVQRNVFYRNFVTQKKQVQEKQQLIIEKKVEWNAASPCLYQGAGFYSFQTSYSISH